MAEIGASDLCRGDSGHDLALIVCATVYALIKARIRGMALQEAIVSGDSDIVRPEQVAKYACDWLGASCLVLIRSAALEA